MATITLRLCEMGVADTAVDTGRLPIFYMNDYSELALRVSELAPACEILRSHGVAIQDTAAGSRLRLASHRQIGSLVAALTAHGLKADLSDRVGGIYQG
ncbi:MAG: hypothetical protein QNJ22_08295 [Desulfosarcinaceae bacterium]|nr:hypothetical protein [Desulfosarcinaceae bacterium]